MRKFMMISVLLIFAFQVFAKDNLFNELKTRADLKSNELLAVLYLNPATCSKCYIEPFAVLKVIEKFKTKNKIKIIALVRCDREIELSIFKRETEWKYYMYVDDGNARKKLGAKNDAFCTILNSKGNNLLNLYTGNYRKNLTSIKDFFDSQ